MVWFGLQHRKHNLVNYMLLPLIHVFLSMSKSPKSCLILWYFPSSIGRLCNIMNEAPAPFSCLIYYFQIPLGWKKMGKIQKLREKNKEPKINFPPPLPPPLCFYDESLIKFKYVVCSFCHKKTPYTHNHIVEDFSSKWFVHTQETTTIEQNNEKKVTL